MSKAPWRQASNERHARRRDDEGDECEARDRQMARHNGDCPRCPEVAGNKMICTEPTMTNALERYLDNDSGAGRVMAHARLLLDLTRRFEAAAPAGLDDIAHIANYKLGKVVIHADNGAAAVKIRQLSQRLCDELSKGGAECNHIEVKVQPRQIPCQSRPSTSKPLSAGACGALRSASESLPDGPLRNALDVLLARAARQE